MKQNKEAQFMDFLADFITENKRTKIDEVLKKRTRYLAVVLEDIFKEHNASAVVRTCECLGIQDLHTIQNRYEFNVNPDVVRGSSNWIDIIHYQVEAVAEPAEPRPAGRDRRPACAGWRRQPEDGGAGRSGPWRRWW